MQQNDNEQKQSLRINWTQREVMGASIDECPEYKEKSKYNIQNLY